jgi:hypothetical protein
MTKTGYLERPKRNLHGILALAIALTSLTWLLAPQPASANEFFAPDAEQLYFEQTGQVLAGVFLEAWQDLGGIGRTGKPISPAVHEGDRWVQWFEYVRLEVPNGETVAENVTFAPAGRLYADKIGYSRWHPAFQPVAAAGEGARYFEETRHTLANAMLNAWSNNDYETKLGMPISEEFNIGSSIYQFFEHGAFAWTEDEGVVLVPIGILDATTQGQLAPRVEKPDVATIWNQVQFNFNHPAAGERWIEVNLSTYTMTAYVGTTPVIQSSVVIGASVSPTVQGEFHIQWKLESQDMEGIGWDGTEYRQEDVPWVMYFFEDYALHGAHWRDSFGYAASQGCVNLPVDVARQLYEWAPYGTRVVVHSG